MKDKLRKYKGQTHVMDLELTKKQNIILAMEDTIATLHQQLQVEGGACVSRASSTEG